MISLIVAIDSNRAIGNRGDLLYHFSEDLRRFKALTTGHTVLMGRKTFESLPNGALPNRRNIVLTTREGYAAPGIETAGNISKALAMIADDPEVYIIGGEEIYRQFLPLADRLLLTLVKDSAAEADAYFPLDEDDSTGWLVTNLSEQHTDPKTGLSFTFMTLERVH